MSAADLPDPTPREWAVIAYLCGDNKELAPNIQKQVDDLLTFKGASHLHVAVQWDLPDGGERAVLNESGTWERERIDSVNTGDPEVFLTFLRWAFDRCPSERVLVVASGTGLLDPRASIGGPGHDRHLFTICNDATAADALSLSEVRRLFRHAVAISNRDQIDIVALDMRELQCLEVAYELEDAVSVLIAPQTRIPDSGWNFASVLRAMDDGLAQAAAATPLSAQDMAKLIVRTVGASYDLTHHGDLSLSALDLRALNPVASAFDTLSLAMVHSVGEELVWKARGAVALRLKPPQPPPDDSTDRIRMSEADVQLSVEREYLYDLPEMLTELAKELEQNAETAMVDLVVDHFAQLDPAGVAPVLESIDTACFTSGSRLRVPALQASIGDPKGTRRRLRQVLKRARTQALGVKAKSGQSAELSTLLTHADSKVGANRSWIEHWPDEVIAALDPDLANTYRVAFRQQQRLFHLSALTTRVLSLLKSGNTPDAGTGRIVPLILEHFVGPDSARATRHGGVSLYRPQDLDRLIASDYLDLRFNRKIHWTVLLAVVNLIDKHPRGLWRILSAVLATADNTTRAQLIDRIAGPGSVIAPFREQFVVLAPVKAFVLSLEPDPNAAIPVPAIPKGAADPQGRGPQAYRVRLELAEREAFISEVSSIVDPDAMRDVVTRLVELLKSSGGVTEADVKQLESLGETLGEDILQDLGIGTRDQCQRLARAHSRAAADSARVDALPLGADAPQGRLAQRRLCSWTPGVFTDRRRLTQVAGAGSAARAGGRQSDLGRASSRLRGRRGVAYRAELRSAGLRDGRADRFQARSRYPHQSGGHSIRDAATAPGRQLRHRAFRGPRGLRSEAAGVQCVAPERRTVLRTIHPQHAALAADAALAGIRERLRGRHERSAAADVSDRRLRHRERVPRSWGERVHRAAVADRRQRRGRNGADFLSAAAEGEADGGRSAATGESRRETALFRSRARARHVRSRGRRTRRAHLLGGSDSLRQFDRDDRAAGRGSGAGGAGDGRPGRRRRLRPLRPESHH